MFHLFEIKQGEQK